MFPNTVAKSGVGAVQQMVNGLNITGPGGSATPLFADANSWNTQIAPTTGNPNNFLGLTGYNPNGIATSSVIVEDLYKGVNSGGTVSMNYVGYFTFDNTGASPSFGFTPSAFVPVPEPATYGLMAGVGLLLLSLRRQLGKA